MNKNIKELIGYAFVGVLTTLVNFVFYYLTLTLFPNYWLLANSIAWFIAVLFAFHMNKTYVFKSEAETGKEAISFFVLRLTTLGIETLLLFICIQLLLVSPLYAKILVSIFTILSNYILCKQKVFNTEKGVLQNGQN